MSCALTSLPRLQGAATPEMRLGVEQHRAGDDRRYLVDAELLERGLRRGLHVALRIAAVIGRAAGGKLALAVPGVGQHREVPQCVHLRALLAGIAAHHLVGVEGMTGAGNAHRGLGVLAQGHRERRLRHGVRAQERQLVGFRGGIGEIGRAALPRGGAERIRHPDLVARRPGRAVLRLRGKRAGPQREQNSNGSKDAVHDALLATATGAGHCALPDHSGRLSCLRAGISSLFSRSIASARATRARVACGMITSSM